MLRPIKQNIENFKWYTKKIKVVGITDKLGVEHVFTEQNMLKMALTV